MKHTPGPWKATKDGFIYQEGTKPPIMTPETGEVIGEWIDFTPGTADCALVTAAPDLLEALKAFLEWNILREEGDPYVANMRKNIVVEQVRKAIAKAEGR